VAPTSPSVSSLRVRVFVLVEQKEREEIIALCCNALGIEIQFHNLPLLMEQLSNELHEGQNDNLKVGGWWL